MKKKIAILNCLNYAMFGDIIGYQNGILKYNKNFDGILNKDKNKHDYIELSSIQCNYMLFKYVNNNLFNGLVYENEYYNYIPSANTVIQGAHNNIVSANTVFSGHVLFEGVAKAVGTTTGFSSATAVSTDAQQTFTKAQVPSTSTATLASTSGVLDFDTHQNFIITLASGSNTLAAPTTEASQIGQTGVIVFIQPSSGAAASLTLHGDYESVGSGGISLSTGNNDYDIVPYFIKADNSILLGESQKNFG